LLAKPQPGWLGLTITSAAGRLTWPSSSTSGQVVVGDQHAQAVRPGMGHARQAGDAVVHRHQHVGRGWALDQVDDGGVRP
jgi:hypothetical protein